MRIRWLRTALANLDAEARYISLDDLVAADRTVRIIFSAAERLTRYLAMGRPGRVVGTRELVIPGTSYVLPYRVRRDVIEIIRVFHGARKWPADL